MDTLIRILALLAFGICLAGCDKTVRWKEDVQLHDGRVILVERLGKQHQVWLPVKNRLEVFQSISFVNPDTGEKLSWDIPGKLLPYTLDFEKGKPYLVLIVYTVSGYNQWECPNPPYLVYLFESSQWRPISFDELPMRFKHRNLIDLSKEYERYGRGGRLTLEDFGQFLLDSPPEYRVIDRKLVNPKAKGCR